MLKIALWVLGIIITIILIKTFLSIISKILLVRQLTAIQTKTWVKLREQLRKSKIAARAENGFPEVIETGTQARRLHKEEDKFLTMVCQLLEEQICIDILSDKVALTVALDYVNSSMKNSEKDLRFLDSW